MSNVIAVVVDESGSMSSYRAMTIDGYNAYLRLLKSSFPTGSEFILVKFSTSSTHIVYKGDLAKSPLLSSRNYSPSGGTPLYDAFIDTVDTVDAYRKRFDRVVVAVITDGEENSSHHDLHTVQRVLRAKQEDGWAFVFMGANQDAWVTGEQLGLKYGMQSFRQDKTRALFEGLARATTVYVENPNLTPEEFWDSTDATKFGGKNRMTY